MTNKPTELERQRRALRLFQKRGDTEMVKRVSRVIAEMELTEQQRKNKRLPERGIA